MLNYIDCKKLINDNQIKTRLGYISFKKTHPEIPCDPSNKYIEWIDWYDFLGKHKKINLSFEKAKEYVSNLNLKSIKQYREWHKKVRPLDIPYSPEIYYKEWISSSDFLGHDYIATRERNFLPFNEAKEYIKKLNLKTQKGWQEWIIKNKKQYPFLPTCPEQIYDEFISYNDWLSKEGVYSNGELNVEKLLIDKSFEFIKQHRFGLCRYKRALPFDFYIPSLNLCIEYDGEQHFEPRYGEEQFIKTKRNDNIKTQYCLDNNIKLIRIAYFEKIEEKLKNI